MRAPNQAANGNFVRLWIGQTVSLVGSRITLLALPTMAITELGAGALEVGVLQTLQSLATPVLGLLVGAWVDRMRHRNVLITTDLARMILLGSVVLAHFTGTLHLFYVYAIALLFGICDIFFNVAYQSYVPALVERDQLIGANVRLEISNSGAQLAGPSLSGLIIGRFGSAVALLVDAVSYAFSALMVSLITEPNTPHTQTKPARRRLLGEIREGLRFVRGHRILRAELIASAVGNLGYGIVLAVLLVYAYRDLGLSPAVTGLALTAANAGFVISAMFARRIVTRWGPGAVLLGSNLVFGIALTATPVASLGFTVPLLIATQLCVSLSLPVYNIVARSLRQVATPDELQGRVNGTFRTVVWGAAPAGALIGGICGELLGTVPAILIGGAVAMASSASLLPASIRGITSIELVAAGRS